MVCAAAGVFGICGPARADEAAPHHPAVGAAPPAAAAPSSPGDPVVARVNGAELHRSDIEAAQRALTPQAQQLAFDKVYPVLLQRLVDGELLIEAGRGDRLAQDPEVQKRLARLEDRVIQQVYVERLIAAGESDERLRARYETFVKETPPREEVHARHILVGSEAEAVAVIAELDKGGDFAALAKKYSKDPGTDSGGDLGYFTREEMVPAFAEAAFALPVGGYSKTPVKTEFGWHAIKIEDRRMAKPPSFEAAHDQIANLLANEIVNERLQALRSVAKIETFGPDGQPLAADK
jgi:peptidyl-prolyl cis-trans isomerase C